MHFSKFNRFAWFYLWNDDIICQSPLGPLRNFFFFSQVSYPLLTYDSLYIWYDFNCNEPDLIFWHINANEFLCWFDDLNCLLWNMRLSDLIIKINHCTLGWEYWKKQAKVVFLIIIAKVFSFCAFISKNDWNEIFFFFFTLNAFRIFHVQNWCFFSRQYSFFCFLSVTCFCILEGGKENFNWSGPRKWELKRAQNFPGWL